MPLAFSSVCACVYVRGFVCVRTHVHDCNASAAAAAGIELSRGWTDFNGFFKAFLVVLFGAMGIARVSTDACHRFKSFSNLTMC